MTADERVAELLARAPKLTAEQRSALVRAIAAARRG